MNVQDEYITVIEKLSNSGEGICRINGCVVFVKNACPKDKLKIKITHTSKNYSNAEILEIIEPSPYRVTPFCSLQNVCGACQLQYIDYNYQLEIKRQIVQDALHSITGIDMTVPMTVAGPSDKCYRHKIQYPVSQTKVSKRLLVGYYKQKSHEIINIKHCPIQPEICDYVIDFIRENVHSFNISGYDEKKHCGDLKHIVLRVSESSGKLLLTLVLNSKKVPDNVKNFAIIIAQKFDNISGVCVNLNPQKTNVILSDKSICVFGKDFVEEKILSKTFVIGADTFFQVNPKSAENIFAYVKQEIQKSSNPVVLDAYAGIAAFGILVSDVSKEVVSVESNPNSIKKAQEVLNINGIKNVQLHTQDTTKYLQNIERKFDITILDPPRKGCTNDSLEAVLSHTKEKIIYVSCNPATLARDLKFLLEKGCKLVSVQPFDMFCHTYHVETVAILTLN